MNIWNLIKYQIYLLQLENYNVARYFFVALNKFGQAPETRKPIVWTNKLQLIVVLAAILGLSVDLLLTWAVGGPTIIGIIVFLILAAGTSFVYFLFLIAACLIFSPADRMLKARFIQAAKLKRQQFPNLKVIAIAGSYGKTTIKEMVAAVLSQRYRVLKTPENINTPLGISRLIQDRLTADIDFFITEVGEYVRGDVKEICDLVQPSVGIITGINQAHLERMGSIENTVASIFEMADHTAGSALILNADDELVRNNYQAHLANHAVQFYSARNDARCEYRVQNVQYSELGATFEVLHGSENLGQFQTALLAEYGLGVALAGIIIAKQFGLNTDQIKAGVSSLRPIAHRLELIPNSNQVTVIDDSYNGNPAGVMEAIKVLARFAGKRKIYVTPGLVEMGAESPVIHYNIGKALAAVADKVILIQNSVTKDIQRGLVENGFSPNNLKIYPTAPQAHGDMTAIVQPGDVVMFQNDWPENYL